MGVSCPGASWETGSGVGMRLGLIRTPPNTLVSCAAPETSWCPPAGPGVRLAKPASRPRCSASLRPLPRRSALPNQLEGGESGRVGGRLQRCASTFGALAEADNHTETRINRALCSLRSSTPGRGGKKRKASAHFRDKAGPSGITSRGEQA